MESNELCTVTLMFPVVNDDEALAVKKKIVEVVSEIKDARIDFRIMSVPDRGPNRNN